MPARRPSGWESKWVGTQRHIPRGPVKNNPPHNPPPRGSYHPFLQIYSLSFIFFFLSSVPACLLLRSCRAEPSGGLLSGGRSSCSRQGSSSSLQTAGLSVIVKSPNVSMRVLRPQTLEVCLPAVLSRLCQKEGRHWTGHINKSRCSHCSVTFSPSTANSGSSQRTHPPLPSLTLPYTTPTHQPLGSQKCTVRGAIQQLLKCCVTQVPPTKATSVQPFLNSSS